MTVIACREIALVLMLSGRFFAKRVLMYFTGENKFMVSSERLAHDKVEKSKAFQLKSFFSVLPWQLK